MRSSIAVYSRYLQMYAFFLSYLVERGAGYLRKSLAGSKDKNNARALNNAIVIEGAEKSGYQVTELPGGFLQISHDKEKHYCRSADFDFESLTAWQLSGDKYVSQVIMESEGLPVPKSICITRKELFRALEFLQESEDAVVAKPLGSCSGKGVVTSIRTRGEMVRGFAYALCYSHGKIIVEHHITGINYRINVLDGEVISIVERMPACVTGDGVSAIKQLIEDKNQTVMDKSSMQMRPIPIDGATRRYLRKQSLTLGSVPGKSVTVNLRGVCNADQGGEIRDVTEITHGSYFELAVKAASAVGVKFCGVDVITDDIRKPFDEAGCMVNEVNTTPALYIFDAPNSSRDTGIGEIIVKRLFRQ